MIQTMFCECNANNNVQLHWCSSACSSTPGAPTDPPQQARGRQPRGHLGGSADAVRQPVSAGGGGAGWPRGRPMIEFIVECIVTCIVKLIMDKSRI